MRKRSMTRQQYRRRGSSKYSHQPTSYSSFPHSFFWMIRLVLMMSLVLGIPMLIFAFEESIKGMLIILALFIIVDVISRINGWDKVKEY